jgi:8-oxo-dGTP pyrophosphatase MutT (NUDIX family)
MATRIDYLEDPAAPPANSVVPSANVIVENTAGEVLVIRRTDNGNYALPGGGMDLGESLTDTARRECREETGYDIEVTGLVGVFSNPGHVLHYTSNDEVRQELSIVYHAHPISDSPHGHDNEASEILWIPRDRLLELDPMHPTMRYRLDLYLQGVSGGHFDTPGEMRAYLNRH